MLCVAIFSVLALVATQGARALMVNTADGIGYANTDSVVADSGSNVVAYNAAIDSTLADSAVVTLPWGERISQGLDQLIESPLFNHAQVSLMVWNLEQDTLVYQLHPEHLMRPASNAKLLLSIATLDALTANYQLKTKMYYRGTVDSTVLRGDVYIKAGFDPLFGASDMQAFVNAFRSRGIDSIDGRIFIDVSMKDTLKWGNGWSWDDDEPVLSPLLYEGKDVFMQKFMAELDAAGISHPATYQRTVIDLAGLEKMAERAHSLRELLPVTLKHSTNLNAEAIFYQLGADIAHPYAGAERSARVIENFIRDSLHLDNTYYTITDGSGLSHYNSYSAQLMINALRFAWKHPQIINVLYDALPIAGVDGTLHKRMVGTTAQNNVHAKTGTLSHVSTLCGYATSIEGVPLAFAIFNAGVRTGTEGRNFQDKVCNLLTN